ncbi:MAG: peroxiredoxin-like family protein [Lutibacter sp.]|uniref:peroxiredoxin-like family protein n=1 Tax=Lutibacter sp. TaxID=1925666 RepID=UPI00385D2966
MSTDNPIKPLKQVKGLKVGKIVTDFSSKDIFGKTHTLSNLTKNGYVVLIFIRGQWCPFCNKHLKTLQKQFYKIYEKGVSVVVVTPEKSEFIKKTIKKTSAEFTILYDEDYKIAKAFDVLFLPNKMMRVVYNTVLGAKLKESHSDASEQLPIPATFIISKKMKVKWRHFNPDYKKRSKIEDILINLN